MTRPIQIRLFWAPARRRVFRGAPVGAWLLRTRFPEIILLAGRPRNISHGRRITDEHFAFLGELAEDACTTFPHHCRPDELADLDLSGRD